MKLHEYINLLPVAANHKEMKRWGTTRPKPSFVCGREVKDDDLNLISLANYILLASSPNDEAFISTLCNVFNITDLYNEEAYIALGFITWATNGINNITKLFSKTSIPPTEEERRAGVETLRFGFFGIIDWYARRMHINHDEAENTAWIRVYKCLDMETKQALYERRLVKVRSDKQKSKAKRGRKR